MLQPVHQDQIKTLSRLGLTRRQAKIYLTLLNGKTYSVKMISKFSHVRREHIYSIIPKLIEMGLVEKIITVPIKFQAVPISDGINILLNRKIDETCSLREEAQKLINTFGKPATVDREYPNEPESLEFRLIPRRSAMIEQRMLSFRNSQNSIDTVTSCNRFLDTERYYGKEIKKAFERGVQIRLCIQEPYSTQISIKIRKIEKLINNFSSFKLKYCKMPTKTYFQLVDNKELHLATVPTSKFSRSLYLWSNNPSMIEIVQTYFEFLWNSASTLNSTDN